MQYERKAICNSKKKSMLPMMIELHDHKEKVLIMVRDKYRVSRYSPLVEQFRNWLLVLTDFSLPHTKTLLLPFIPDPKCYHVIFLDFGLF